MQAEQIQEIKFTEFDEDEDLPLSFTNEAIQAAKDAIAAEGLKPEENFALWYAVELALIFLNSSRFYWPKRK